MRHEKMAISKMSKNRHIPVQIAESVLDLYYKQGGICAYCGKVLHVTSGYPDKEAHLDHIVPTCIGGTTEVENLQWICSECNMLKGALANDFFKHRALRIRHAELYEVIFSGLFYKTPAPQLLTAISGILEWQNV